MSSSTFANAVATALHAIGFSFIIIRIVILLLFIGQYGQRFRYYVTEFTLILNDIIYFVTFLLVLTKPRFFENNKSFWFGFAVALANDVMLSMHVLGSYLHPLLKVAFMLQLGFNFVVMVGSFFEFSIFLPRSKPKQVSPPVALTPVQSYQAHVLSHPTHPPTYTSPVSTMNPLPTNPYKS